MPEPIASSHCDGAKRSAPDSILNYIITLAVILSYFPQYQRIISRGSSHGISPYFMLLSTLYTTSALANLLLFDSVKNGYTCCRTGNFHGATCFEALTDTTQAALQWLGSTILFIMYLIFYPRPPLPEVPRKRHSLFKSDLALSPERRRIEASIPYPYLLRIIASISLLLTLLILIPTLTIVLDSSIASRAPPSLLQDWSFFTSTLSLLAATLQFLPQMHTTLRLKHHHSLSMVMLAIQIPVYLLLGINKASKSDSVPHDGGRGHPWVRWLQNGEVAWMNYIVGACVEGLLLALCLYLYFVRPRFASRDWDGDEEAEEEEYITGVSVGEDTPLLPGGDRTGLQTSRWSRREVFVGG